MPPCHRLLSTAGKSPPPVTTESTSAMAAQASAGMTAKRHGLLLAQRMARPGLARHRAPAAATTKKATAPAASEPLSAPTPRLVAMMCRPRSPTATTAPVAAAAPHGAPDMAALETDISSRRDRSCSLRVGADINTPSPSSTSRDTHVISRLSGSVSPGGSGPAATRGGISGLARGSRYSHRARGSAGGRFPARARCRSGGISGRAEGGTRNLTATMPRRRGQCTIGDPSL
jgi:hypothetical protein